MKMKTLLTLAGLLLFSLACTFDLGAAGTALRSASVPPGADFSLTATAIAPFSAPTATETHVTHAVCTGVPNGHLRVRRTAGTDSAVVTVLAEGNPVIVSQEVTNETGTWAFIVNPAGWVNIRFLCSINPKKEKDQ